MAAAIVEQAEIVILAVGAATAGLVIILEPVNPDYVGIRGEVAGGAGCAERPLGLSRHGHQGTVIQISRAILSRGEIPFRNQYGLVAAELMHSIEIVMRN